MLDKSEKFWDKIAERYSQQPIADEAAYEKKLEVTREYLHSEMEVLEFGCGTGSTAITHAPYVKHIHAIDISSKMIAIAQGKADANNVTNVTFQQSNIGELSQPDQSLDAVLGLSILHLLDNVDEVIAKVYRILKPGGVFVTSTVCIGDSMLRYLKPIAPIARFFGLMPMLKVLTANDLKDKITGAGFEIDQEWQPGKHKTLFIVAKKTAVVKSSPA